MRGASLPVALLVALVVLVAGDERRAAAHDGSHAFASVVDGITPSPLGAGIDVRMLDADEQLELVNRSGHTVVVEGYEGEPYARITSDGPVFVNVMSPSMAPSNDRLGRTRPNGNEDASAPPRWVRVGDGGRYRWFDRRTHYRRQGVPSAVTDREERTKLWDYRIPITVGTEAAEIRGTLYWVGIASFPTALFVVMLVATAACLLFGAWVLKRLRSGDEEGTPPTEAL